MGIANGFGTKGRLFKAEFTVWLDEQVCVMRLPDGTECTDGMAVYEALVVDTEYDGWVLDWKEQEIHIVPQEEDDVSR